MVRRGGGTADIFETVEQEGIHRHGDAIGRANQMRLIMAIDTMLIELFEISIGYFDAEHLMQLLPHAQAIDADHIGLGDFVCEGSDILVVDIGVGVYLGAGRRVARLTVLVIVVEVRLKFQKILDVHDLPPFVLM